MPKILYVATVVKTHIMEFHIPYLHMLKKMGWETSVAAKNDYDNPTDCLIPYCDSYYDIPFERNPLKPGNLRAYKKLKKIIDEGNYNIIHCHTPVGAMLTRLAARKARKNGSMVFYTAHGFHFYKGAPALNWLLYYPIEKYLARKTDVLITINEEDYRRAKHFRTGKVHYIPGVGVDIQKYSSRVGNRDEKRAELGLKTDDFLIVSVGALITRKNHSVMLDALSELKREGILDHIQYVICGSGELEKELKDKASSLAISDHVHLLGFRNDVSEIYNAADLFVSMSFQEKCLLSLMEAMACGLPVVCSDTKENKSIIVHGQNGEIVDGTATATAADIKEMLINKNLRIKLAHFAALTAKTFDFSVIETVISNDIYTDEKIISSNTNDRTEPKCLFRLMQKQKLKKELGIPLDAPVLLSVGELNRNKNHKVVIEALQKLKDCWYIICGHGPLMDEYKRLAEVLGVNKRLIMTGYRTDVATFYHIADIFVFPSFREGLPVSVMEAMAAGLPVVCTKIRGNVDLVKENYGGCFFSPYSSSELVSIIQNLLSARETLVAFGNYNAKAINRYGQESVVNQVIDLYLGVNQCEQKA